MKVSHEKEKRARAGEVKLPRYVLRDQNAFFGEELLPAELSDLIEEPPELTDAVRKLPPSG